MSHEDAAPIKRKARARKAREAFGQLDALPSGRIRARYTDPETGRRHSAPRTFDNKGDARTWLRGVATDMSRGVYRSPDEVAAERAASKQTLGDYAEGWLITDRNRRGEPKRPRTVDEYRRLLAGPLAELTKLPLSSITPEVVDRWFERQGRTGKLTQASRAYSLLSTIFAHAVDRASTGITSNPCKVKGAQSARTGRKVVPPTEAQLDAILAHMDPRFIALVHLAAAGGLRYGEASDLRRSDVDVNRDESGKVTRVRVSITHAVTRTSKGFQSGPPKSAAGERSVFIYGDAAVAIAAHLDERVGRFGDPLLFPAVGDDTGTRWLSQSTFHTPWWSNARDAAGRPDMPFHALRHFAGTAYAQQGATMAETMARLGHSSTAVAMRYQHATDRDAELAERMSRRAT